MCLDGQALSAYLDGEVSSPVKESMDAHLAECPACRATLEGMSHVHFVLHDDDLSWLDESRGRILQNIYARLGEIRERGFFRRKISIPMPVAAAAAVLILFLGGLLIFRPFDPGFADLNSIPVIAGDGSGEVIGAGYQQPRFSQHAEVTIKVSSMEQLKELLDSQGAFSDVTIELPDMPDFEQAGDPQLLTAQEYERNRGE